MNPTPPLSRRAFVGLAASVAALTPLAGSTPPTFAQSSGSAADPWLGLKMGIASYTFSRLPLEATIQGIRRVGVHYVSIKDAHLPLKSSVEKRKAVVKKFRDAAITPLSCGVVSLTDEESRIRNAFEYARDASIPTIVCKPTRESLPILDKLVKEFDLKLAIHNHGPEDKVWPSPLDVWEAIQKFDARIGVCVERGAHGALRSGPFAVDPDVRHATLRRAPQRPLEQGRPVPAGRGRAGCPRYSRDLAGAAGDRLRPSRRSRARERHG